MFKQAMVIYTVVDTGKICRSTQSWSRAGASELSSCLWSTGFWHWCQNHPVQKKENNAARTAGQPHARKVLDFHHTPQLTQCRQNTEDNRVNLQEPHLPWNLRVTWNTGTQKEGHQDLSPPRFKTYMVEKENQFLQVSLCPPYTCCGMHALPTPTKWTYK